MSTPSTTTESLNSSLSDLLGFQCASCLASYSNETEYKLHYKSDFHKYNVLRKMVELPSISRHQFEKHQQGAQKILNPESDAGKSHYCETCKKKFGSSATLNQHYLTKKHQMNEAMKASNLDVSEQVMTENKVSFKKNPKKSQPEQNITRESPQENKNACLLCSQVSATFEENLTHMRKTHGFFILEEDCCKNKEGLFDYLADKIFNKKQCMYYDYNKCGNFKTGQAVQLHMIDKGHTFMNQNCCDEYYKFYDFTEANEEAMKKLESKYANCKGGVEFEFAVTVNDQDEDWEDIDSDVDSNDEPIIKGTDEKKKNQKIYKLRRATVLDSGELLLPSGRIAGHEKFKRIYKQKPIIHSGDPQKMVESKSRVYRGDPNNEGMVKKFMNSNNALVARSDMEKFQAKENHKIHKKLQKYRRTRDNNWMKLGVAGNLSTRKYYVDQTISFG